MRRVRATLFFFALVALHLQAGATAQQARQIVAGQNFNVNPGVADQFVGDKYLQRQVEPKIVCASSNTQLCVAVANDYRTVDATADSLAGLGEAKLRPDLLGQKTRTAAAPDAWLGLYRTWNGGLDWWNGMVPGSPPDVSDLGRNQPWSGLAAASDGALATDGVHFFGVGLFFNRGGTSMIGAFRLTAYNDESILPIRWDAALSRVIDKGAATSTGVFADLPSIIADVPRATGLECGNVYIAYARFSGAPVGNSFVYFSRSSDCGQTYSKPVKISGTFNMTQRAVIAIDPRPGTPTTTGGGTLYVVFRTFLSDQFVFARSTDYGATWTAPAPITNRSGPNTLCTYDQPTVGDPSDMNEQTARAMAFASVQVDSTGKLHVVWTERVDPATGLPPPGGSCTADKQPKILYTSSSDRGKTWTTRKAIDAGTRCETVPTMDHAAGLDRSAPGGGACPEGTQPRPSGPQIQPSLAHSAGNLILLYSEGRAIPATAHFLSPAGYHAGRDTQMDTRAARIDPATGALLSTTQVSRYAIDAATNDLTEVANANSPDHKAYNRAYLPQYKGGTLPFKGDHDDLVPVETVVWDPPQHFAGPGDIWGLRFRGIWGGDNREALFPGGDLGGNWSAYESPGSGDVSACNAGIRNSNNYVAYVGSPIEAFVHQSFKPAFGPLTGPNNDRSWVITVRNHSSVMRTVKFALDERAGDASFAQFQDVNVIGNNPSDPYCLNGIFPACTAYRTILPYSSMTFTVFGHITDTTVAAPFRVGVFEGNTAVTPVTDTPVAIVRLNPNPNNPAPLAGKKIENNEFHGPSLEGPFVGTHANPTQGNPTQGNPTQGNPTQGNPTQGNPTQGNPTQGNAGFSDYTDYRYVVRSGDANTLSGYSAFAAIANAAEVDQSHLVQMIITRRHKVPTLIPPGQPGGCSPTERIEDEVISTITVSSSSQLSPTQGNPTQGNPTQGNPTQGNPTQGNPTQGNPTQGNNTFALSPQNAPASSLSGPTSYTATAIASALAQAVSSISSDTGPDGTLVATPETDEVHVTLRFFHCDSTNGPCGPITFPDGTTRSFDTETLAPGGTETVVPRSCSSDPCEPGEAASGRLGFWTTAEAGDNTDGTVASPIPVGVGPDLFVSAPAVITITPSTVVTGGQVLLSDFTVSNGGDVSAGPSSYRILAVPADGSGTNTWLGDSVPLASVAAGGSLVVSPGLVSVTALQPGTYYVGPYIDDQNLVGEVDEFNNFKWATLVVEAPPAAGADLIVQTLTHYPANPTTLDLITVTATVANVGQAPAGQSWLELCVGGETPGPDGNCQHTQVPILPPGQTFIAQREVTLDVARGYRNTARADYLNGVAELDETNNVTTDDFIVAAPAGVTVSGTVFYSTGTLNGVTVELVPDPQTNDLPIRRTTTDANGSYGFPLIGPGSYLVKAFGPSPEYITWEGRGVTVATSNVTQDVDLPKTIALISPQYGTTNTSLTPMLTWTANAEAVRYVVQINVTTGGALVTQAYLGNTTSYSVPSGLLTANTNYTWQVDAYDASGHFVGTTEQLFTFTTGTGFPIP